eukprot:TRINITY_DN4024_c0_g1_i1.p1 TRINITY_DN4024_c0_g1~~TRINITY_DN4024_c0_g1_i1.p1  ORF type:complete len:350 (+),score=109.77 TRINITY_DN4024_c0_g1_i1:899-1948(+)
MSSAVERATPQAVSRIRAAVMLAFVVTHTIGAHWTTAVAAPFFPTLTPSPLRDVLSHLLYLVALDGTFAVFSVQRCAVRAFHWKVNTPLMAVVLILYFAPEGWTEAFMALGLAVMVGTYRHLAKDAETPAMRVGLEKYLKAKKGDDYMNTTVGRNWQYPFLCAIQLYCVLRGYVCCLSPIYLFILDALWLRLRGKTRTKAGDLLYTTFVSPMDTGLFVLMFAAPCTLTPLQTVGCTLLYLLYVHVVCRVNGRLISETYDIIIENKWRWFVMAAFTLVSMATGVVKNDIASGVLNMAAAALIYYASGDVFLHVLPEAAVEKLLGVAPETRKTLCATDRGATQCVARNARM